MKKTELDQQTVHPDYMRKRDGSIVPFDCRKIREAIRKANATVPMEKLEDDALERLTKEVASRLCPDRICGVEEIQDLVEDTLIRAGKVQTAKAYILYREKRATLRTTKNDLMDILQGITFDRSSSNDIKRENANIDADTAMGTMLKYGSESSKYFVDHYILPEEIASAHREGLIHIHDKDFYMLTETCCQIELKRLFEKGFSTGHGNLSSPQGIQSYAALACIVIQANQNEMHGGQSIPDFDYAMAPGVDKAFRKLWSEEVVTLFDLLKDSSEWNEVDEILSAIERDHLNGKPMRYGDQETIAAGLRRHLLDKCGLTATSKDLIESFLATSCARIERKIVKETRQAMQALIHNLNTMNSRAGAQVPFSSINYGTDISASGRLVIEQLLLATMDGLGHGETPIFPVQIFKVKDGINFNESDVNFDLFQLAIKTSAKRLFPNFSFLDAPFNKTYYRFNHPETEVAYMGCRTRVMANSYDPEREVTYGRGNLSFTSINLPRLAIEAHGDIAAFYARLDETMDLVIRQLLHRFEIQARKRVYNYPFLMGQGVWIDSERLALADSVREVLKHGTLSIGFIGLAEALVALVGTHHGESEKAQILGLEIVEAMRRKCDAQSALTQMNFTLLATPAEGLSGRFVKCDKAKFGIIKGVTDHDFYTNSFHVPVYYALSAFEKINREAPYHALTNAGHISYVEMDGDPSKNLLAFEQIIRHMKESGIGYGSINHPVDYDPVCGYTGIIDNACPRCHREETPEARFHRIRRITGYLVGTVERFNDAKRAELLERVKHRV